MTEVSDDDLGLLLVGQAAKRYDLKPKTVRRWIDRGLLTRRRDQDGRIVVSERELLDVEYATRQHPSGWKRA